MLFVKCLSRRQHFEVVAQDANRSNTWRAEGSEISRQAEPPESMGKIIEKANICERISRDFSVLNQAHAKKKRRLRTFWGLGLFVATTVFLWSPPTSYGRSKVLARMLECLGIQKPLCKWLFEGRPCERPSVTANSSSCAAAPSCSSQLIGSCFQEEPSTRLV